MSSVESRSGSQKRNFSGCGTWFVAGTVWLIGVSTTVSFLEGLGVPSGASVFLGFVIQIGLTKLETAVWTGKANGWTWGAFSFDVMLNAGGIWEYTKGFWNTEAGAMLNDVISSAFGFSPRNIVFVVGITVNVGSIIVGIITLFLGILIAYAPEGIVTNGR